MPTYESYCNIAPTYLCELINKKNHVNTGMGTDLHQLIMPPISKDCSITFSNVHSFMLLHTNGTN